MLFAKRADDDGSSKCNRDASSRANSAGASASENVWAGPPNSRSMNDENRHHAGNADTTQRPSPTFRPHRRRRSDAEVKVRTCRRLVALIRTPVDTVTRRAGQVQDRRVTGRTASRGARTDTVSQAR